MKSNGFEGWFRVFLAFALVSGVGWLIDLTVFLFLLNSFGVSELIGNFVSSFVGVTFVWFTSLRSVFRKRGALNGRLLGIYWGFQFASIYGYSLFLAQIVALLMEYSFFDLAQSNLALLAKIFVTPFNLLTNCLFMSYLARYMKSFDGALNGN